MRKYIHIARCMKPKLTEEASAVIAEEYSKLRSEDMVEYDVARVSLDIFLFLQAKRKIAINATYQNHVKETIQISLSAIFRLNR